MNIEPIRKIVSSFLLESNGSWGSGIIGMTAKDGTLKDSAPRRWFDAVSVSRIREPRTISSLTRQHVLELINCRLLRVIPVDI